jgi:hypothetical protein
MLTVDLTDDDLATAAQACRAMASQQATRAKTLQGTSLEEMSRMLRSAMPRWQKS